MADITHNDPVVTESKLKDFYDDIKPFLGCPAYLTSEGTSDYYSTDEKVVGRWIDGKPLYQKTFINTMPTATSTTGGRKAVSIGASIEDAFLISADMTTNGTVLPLYNTNSGLTIYARVMITTNTTTDNPNCVLFDLSKGGQGWSGYPVKAVIRYTKTTDSATTTIQKDSNEYSTTEKIIGKWVDGKPIYQKTITDLNITMDWNNQYYTMGSIDIPIANVKQIISAKASFSRNNNNVNMQNLNIITDSTSFPNKWVLKGIESGTMPSILTVQYTKTTD